jgi:hypothetical protein
MIHFLAFCFYIMALIVSISTEALTVLGDSKERPTADWIYAGLVLLMFLLETPSWVYKPAFTLIMIITFMRWGLEHLGWYSGPVERADSLMCLVLLLIALAVAVHSVVIESL